MKKIIVIITCAVAVVFTSCKKNETPQPNSGTMMSYNVEYRIENNSGNVQADYVTYQNGTYSNVHEVLNRNNESISFTGKAGINLSLSAYNSTPSAQEVIVQIFVNGRLVASGDATAPGVKAEAKAVCGQ